MYVVQEEELQRVKEEQERREEEEYQRLKESFIIEDQGEAEELTEHEVPFSTLTLLLTYGSKMSQAPL